MNLKCVIVIMLMISCSIGIAQQPDTLPCVSIPKIDRPLKLDGETIDSYWDKSSHVILEYYPKTSTKSLVANTRVSFLHDGKMLYLAFDCEDDLVIATKSESDDQTFGDDCVEILLGAPDVRLADTACLEINPIGTMADFYYRHSDWINYRFTSHARVFTFPKTAFGKKGYRVEIAIPFSSLIPLLRQLDQGNLSMPKKIRANFARWDRGGKNQFSIWSDPQLNLPHPHNPDRFGWLFLE